MGKKGKKPIKRVNLFAGPGAGKSTLAAWLFAELKMNDVDAEHIQEYVKAWTFLGQPPKKFDQWYIFGKQMHREDIILRSNGASVVITESPLFLGTCYAMRYKTPGWKHLMALVEEFEQEYPSLNVFIDRKDLEYKSVGRFQDHKGALAMDRFILRSMDKFGLKYARISYDDLQGLKCLVNEAIGLAAPEGCRK